MKETKKVCSLLKQEMQWEKMTLKQRFITVWFSLSFVVLGVSGESVPIAVAALANFTYAAYCVVKYVPIKDE